MVEPQSTVKRKAIDSIIWEDSTAKSSLYFRDTVLTLENSSARMKLVGDVDLKLHENTLILLEPVIESEADILKVRFYKGDLKSNNRQRRLAIGAGDWAIEARPGSDLSLRTLSNGQLEVELATGNAEIKNRKTGEKEDLLSQTKIVVSETTIQSQQKISDKLSFENLPQRIYSHDFPIEVELAVRGPAEELRVVDRLTREKRIPISNSSIRLQLNPGLHSLSLEGADDQTSPTFSVEVLPAPRLRSLHPLPRDRKLASTPTLFSWIPNSELHLYRLVIVSSDDLTKSEQIETPLSHNEISRMEPGLYYWKIEGIDASGYTIPAPYQLPLYLLTDPLEAPRLQKPIERIPAEKNGALNQFRFLEKLWSWLVPSAHANTLARNQRQIILSWYPVEGADHYIIEISSDPGFLKPEVVEKVKHHEFKWKSFQVKNYYWRVAGGTEDGRMGIFSEPEVFDVANLTTSAEKGVRVAETSAPKEELAPPPKTPAPPTPSEPKRALPENKLRAAYEIDYWVHDQQTADFDQLQFRGGSDLSLKAEYEFNFGERRIEVLGRISQLTWTPENLPFQKPVKTNIFDLKVEKRDPTWGWGLSYRHSPRFFRADLEAVDAKAYSSFGVFRSYRNALTPSRHFQFQVGAEYGFESFQFSGETRLRFFNKIFHGPGFDWMIRPEADDFKNQFFRLNYEFGYEF